MTITPTDPAPLESRGWRLLKGARLYSMRRGCLATSWFLTPEDAAGAAAWIEGQNEKVLAARTRLRAELKEALR